MYGTLYEFFDKVNDCSLSDIEVINYIEKITDNYKKEKIELLIRDLKFYISVLQEEKASTIPKEEIEKALNNPENEIYISEIEFNNEKHTLLNVELIFFPNYLFGLKKLLIYLNHKSIEILEYVKGLQGNKTEIEEYIPPKLTIKHKITLLHELGIIEHIRKRQKFGLSTNQIAKVIALLLSEGVGTIQSDLSALENKNKDKTPLKKNNIQKIHDYLINIGFSNDSFETKTPL